MVGPLLNHIRAHNGSQHIYTKYLTSRKKQKKPMAVGCFQSVKLFMTIYFAKVPVETKMRFYKKISIVP